MKFLQGRIKQEAEIRDQLLSHSPNQLSDNSSNELHGATSRPPTDKSHPQIPPTKTSSSITTSANFPKTFIIDRTIHEDSLVFANSHHLSGLMSPEEYSQYTAVYMQSLQTTPESSPVYPSILFYLRVPAHVLVQRIKNRGRDMEQKIDEKYLQGLETLYEGFVERMRVCGVEVVQVENFDAAELQASYCESSDKKCEEPSEEQKGSREQGYKLVRDKIIQAVASKMSSNQAILPSKKLSQDQTIDTLSK